MNGGPAMDVATVTITVTWRDRLLDRVERLGNALPDPVVIFVAIIAVLMVVSAVGAHLGWSATNPVTGEVLVAKSLLSEASVRQLLTEMPRTFTGFTPLGLALLIMLGAGVAEGSGMFGALLRKAFQRLPATLLVPATIIMGMLTVHAVDAGYLVFPPLAGLVFANAGRNPVVGVICGFIGCATGLAGNMLPGQYDVLIFGVTQVGARLLIPAWEMNPLGNWWFMLAIAVAFTGVGWLIVEKSMAPRIGNWSGHAERAPISSEALTASERRALRRAGLAAAAVIAVFASLALLPGYSPLIDRAAEPDQQALPLFRAIPAMLCIFFVATGWAYGKAAGTVASHREVVGFMAKGLEGMAPYLVLAFFAAHFVALFGWSNLAPIVAIHGATILRQTDMPMALLLPMLTTASAGLDFLIASGSAKWTAMAPVAVPMLMLLGISPEMATAAYRVGDTVTNLVSPLNPYFILTLIYCQRWMPAFRLGSLLAATLPIAVAFYFTGVVITAVWVSLEIPLGPGAAVAFALPQPTG